MSYPSQKRRLRPARGVAAMLATLMAAAAGFSALPSAQAAVLPTSGPIGNVQTMAGSMQNYSQWGPCTATSCPGDGGPSTAAQLYNPRAIAFDPNTGDLYVADALNERIRKVDIATGNISTFAGTGPADTAAGLANGSDVPAISTAASIHDGGPATQALFDQPHGIAVDSHGNVYVSDSKHNRIREIDKATGNINTIAGNGDPKAPACPTSLPCLATASGLKFPKSMFMAPGDKLYVADSGHNMIRMIDLNAVGGPMISTVAGTSQGSNFNGDGKATQHQLNQPEGVAVDQAGNVYIADSGNNLVRKVDTSGNLITLAGDTAAAQAHALDAFGTVWDSDSNGDGGPAAQAHLDGPRGIAVDSFGNVYIGQESGSNTTTDTTGSRIRKIDTTGTIQTIAGDGRTNGRGQVPGDPGPSAAGSVEFNTMHDLTMDSHNNLWVADSKNNLVRVLWDAPDTVTTSIVATPPTTGPNGCTSNCTPVPGSGKSGYWMLGNDGKVYGFGDAKSLMFGDASTRMPAAAKAVHIEPTPDAQGYWINDDKGGVYAFGDADSTLGGVDPSALQAGEKVTSLSSTPSGHGYWLFTSKGRVFTHGDARSFGDLSALTLNGPVLGSIPTPSGQGYYMVASDGGVFAFGDAKFMGSMGNKVLNKPVEALVPTRDGAGYWLVASDGGIFAFGNAPFKGSMGATQLNKPVTGMVRYGDGYLMVGADGGIFDFSSKPFQGSLGDNPPAHPVVFAATLDS